MYEIIVQRVAKNVSSPTSLQLRRWAKHALQDRIPSAELTIRIVNEDEMTALNTTYRHKTGPTNVLSFPFDMPESVDIDVPLLGDIVICAEVVNREANNQDKSIESHWAHMVVHGTLHLLGYDHEIEAEAIEMENQEVQILRTLGFNNPYQTNEKGTLHE